jgi:uncharacterized radical SAM protein YgiQ
MPESCALDFLPVSQDEIQALGWDQPDVIIVSGDAYVDHPSFGTAVIARVAEFMGLRVAVLPQPNWRDDLRDFLKLGKPRLFFGVTAGTMDSMINHYTSLRRKRSNDAYTPGGRAGYRPDMPTIVYTKILKKLFPEVPVIIGGIEASMRRFSHYDYWQDKLRPSVLVESGADMLVYGMGEKSFMKIIELMNKGVPLSSLHNIPQTAFVRDAGQDLPTLKDTKDTILPSHQQCLSDKLGFAQAFRIIEQASNSWKCDRLIQPHAQVNVVVNPPYEPLQGKDADFPFDLPYSRLPHPKYKNKPPIPAFEMIRNSVNIHRGCFGGCSFCTISAHQGKFVSSRSEQSILKELELISQQQGFKGHITDLGGPSANMYKMGGIDMEKCRRCSRPSCIFPNICNNLNYDHNPLIRLYDKAAKMPGIKKITIGSGIRYDMLLDNNNTVSSKYGLNEYIRKLLLNHVSGRLKVAPEHTSAQVLRLMRKPSFDTFSRFQEIFLKICRQYDLNWQLVPYFISGHPGCHENHMKELSGVIPGLKTQPELVQEFTPTPMTLASTMYYAGIDPYSGKKIFSASSDFQKRKQKEYFFRLKG